MRMSSKFVLTVCFAALATSACEAQTVNVPAGPSADIETLKPVNSVATPETTPYNVEELSSGLNAPWGLAFLPGGDMLITEKTEGMVRRADDGTVSRVSGLPEAYVARQGGYLDVVLSPDFETDQTVYVSYSYGSSRANGTAVFKGVIDGDTLSGTTIFKTDPPKARGLHYGGRMAFLPDGTFVLTMGEGYGEMKKAQSRDNHFGKMLRLNPDGSAADDNPFADQKLQKPEIYSFGHRNPQGLLYDAETNRIWAHEHGPKGGDELNLILPGENYGWPIATFGIDYSGQQITPFETYVGMRDSVYYWKPSIAPSGFALYRGDLFPEWDGDLFIGGLASQDLRRLDMDGLSVAGETILLDDRGERVRDVRIGSDGAIYVLSESSKDGPGGKLLKITPSN